MVTDTCNYSTQEAEAGECQVQGLPGLCSVHITAFSIMIKKSKKEKYKCSKNLNVKYHGIAK
jgi:hypothetical protein